MKLVVLAALLLLVPGPSSTAARNHAFMQVIGHVAAAANACDNPYANAFMAYRYLVAGDGDATALAQDASMAQTACVQAANAVQRAYYVPDPVSATLVLHLPAPLRRSASVAKLVEDWRNILDEKIAVTSYLYIYAEGNLMVAPTIDRLDEDARLRFKAATALAAHIRAVWHIPS